MKLLSSKNIDWTASKVNEKLPLIRPMSSCEKINSYKNGLLTHNKLTNNKKSNINIFRKEKLDQVKINLNLKKYVQIKEKEKKSSSVKEKINKKIARNINNFKDESEKKAFNDNEKILSPTFMSFENFLA